MKAIMKRCGMRGSGGWWLLLGVVVMIGMNSCAVPEAGYAPAPAGVFEDATSAPAAPLAEAAPMKRSMSGSTAAGSWRAPEVPRERPGLGTGWGDERSSPMSYTSFRRAGTKPSGGVATIYYNDREGVEAMTGWKRSDRGLQKAAGGLVEWGVKSGLGLMKNHYSGGRRFVQGRKGQRYSLMVRNLAKSRLEVVLSVDGLDVLDGKAASTKKRGYIIAPGDSLEVEGWRTSTRTVASFEFASVSGSYANLRHGDTRNVGVIGLAVFTERGVDPWTWMPREVERRQSASPFAEPPTGLAR